MIAAIPANAVRVAQFDDRNWIVVEPYVYVTTLISPGTRIVVPAGFVTDGASVPRVFWRIVPPFGLHFNAAVVHDWLYRNRPHQLTKGAADAVFSEIMARDGVPEPIRIALREAVDLWGASSFYYSKELPLAAADAPEAPDLPPQSQPEAPAV